MARKQSSPEHKIKGYSDSSLKRDLTKIRKRFERMRLDTTDLLNRTAALLERAEHLVAESRRINQEHHEIQETL